MRKKICVLFSIALILLLLIPMPANARFLGHSWPRSGSLTRIPINVGAGIWEGNMHSSVNSWNTHVGHFVRFEHSVASNNLAVKRLNMQGSWFGMAYMWVSGGSSIVQFEIVLNHDHIVAQAINVNNYVRSIMAHELGHILGLADNPSTTSNTIMSHTRQRNIITIPQPFDIESVRIVYGFMSRDIINNEEEDEV